MCKSMDGLGASFSGAVGLGGYCARFVCMVWFWAGDGNGVHVRWWSSRSLVKGKCLSIDCSYPHA